MRQKVRVPTNGSFMILKASIENGSCRRTLALDLVAGLSSMPLIGGTSSGDGR